MYHFEWNFQDFQENLIEIYVDLFSKIHIYRDLRVKSSFSTNFSTFLDHF